MAQKHCRSSGKPEGRTARTSTGQKGEKARTLLSVASNDTLLQFKPGWSELDMLGCVVLGRAFVRRIIRRRYDRSRCVRWLRSRSSG